VNHNAVFLQSQFALDQLGVPHFSSAVGAEWHLPSERIGIFISPLQGEQIVTGDFLPRASRCALALGY